MSARADDIAIPEQLFDCLDMFGVLEVRDALMGIAQLIAMTEGPPPPYQIAATIQIAAARLDAIISGAAAPAPVNLAS